MIWSMERLRAFALRATDGEIGTVNDLFFDDQSWAVRYLVVRAGNWLTGRKVLISPAVAGAPDGPRAVVPVALTRDQVKNSPDIDTDMPVSRQQEVDLHRHYGWTPYWGTPYVAGGPIPSPVGGYPDAVDTRNDVGPSATETGDRHLRSEREVRGYHIGARDGAIGHVEDFLIDDDGWAVRYMVVDTSNWLPGRRVIVSPAWIRDVSWAERKVLVDADRDRIERAPEFDPAQPVGRDYETRLYGHYGWRPYW